MLCTETLPFHFWCLSAILSLSGAGGLCSSCDMRKRDQLHGWNSSLVWVLPEVEPSVGGET